MVLRAVVLAAGACTYPTLAPSVAEGTTVLAPRKVGFTAAGGGGAGTFTIASSSATELGGGIELRARMGLFEDHEIGVSGIAGIATKTTGEPPVVFGGYLSYKYRARRWLAFVGELGGLDRVIASTLIFGGSVAAIFAPYTAGNTQVYTGLKASLTIPVLRDATGSAELFSVPIGISWNASERLRLIGEGGFAVSFGRVNSGGTVTRTAGFGGYGIFAVHIEL